MPAFFGLDIGSSSIKVVGLSGKNVEVAAMAVNPTGKVGVDLVPADQAALLEAVKGLISGSKIKTKRVVVSIPESLVFSRVMEFPTMSSPELATAIKWGAEQIIPFPIDKLELSWVILSKPKNRSIGVKMKVLVVAVPSKISNAYVNFIDSLGLEIVRVENELVSIIRSMIIAKKLSGVSLIADIGFSNTKLAIADMEQLYTNYLSSLSAMAFTRIIAESFRLNVSQAEEYKRVYGLDKGQFEGKLVNSIQPVLSGLVNDINKVIVSYSASYPERKVERIVLVGGGAFLRGLVGVLTEQTGIEVAIGNAFEGLKVTESLAGMGAVFAGAVGLATEEE